MFIWFRFPFTTLHSSPFALCTANVLFYPSFFMFDSLFFHLFCLLMTFACRSPLSAPYLRLRSWRRARGSRLVLMLCSRVCVFHLHLVVYASLTDIFHLCSLLVLPVFIACRFVRVALEACLHQLLLASFYRSRCSLLSLRPFQRLLLALFDVTLRFLLHRFSPLTRTPCSACQTTPDFLLCAHHYLLLIPFPLSPFAFH